MLREHTDILGLPQLLNYDRLAAPGVLRLKDGALLAAWYFAGPDLDLSSPAEMERLSAHVNSALRCGAGWMLHVDVIRRQRKDYLTAADWPDPTSALIDEERRRQFHAGEHYSSVQMLALTFTPASLSERKLASFLYKKQEVEKPSETRELNQFQRDVEEIQSGLSACGLTLDRMTDAELLSYLHLCVTGNDHPVKVPVLPIGVDEVIGAQELIGGHFPRLGPRHLRAVSIANYPAFTQPGAQRLLHELPCAYRWSTRFIFLDLTQAQAAIGKTQTAWWSGRRSLSARIGEVISGGSDLPDRQDKLDMALDANQAAAAVAAGDVVYGLYTMTVLVMDEDEAKVNRLARTIQEQVQQCGFPATVEEANTIEAWLGSCPGHGRQNVRRALVHTLNLADLLPLTSVWSGTDLNREELPPVLLASTQGATPFCFSPYIRVSGAQEEAVLQSPHALIIGPTRAGKSVFKALWMIQFMRYPGAQVFSLDNGWSDFVLTKAGGGIHHAIGLSGGGEFAPLSHVDDEHERAWALGWLSELYAMQGIDITAEKQQALAHALDLMAERWHGRTLSGLWADAQDLELRAGLHPYLIGAGGLGLLDAEMDSLSESRFVTFELESLLSRPDADLIPVLLYLFHRIEQRCTGAPTLIAIDEAWLALLKPRFAQQMDVWVRSMAKKNAALVFCTQSLADVASLEKETLKHLLVEGCPTKIFLPNAEARSGRSARFYEDLGLNERQIDVLAAAIPRKHYLLRSPAGDRVFDLELGRVARALVGAGGSPAVRERIAYLEKECGEGWVTVWLKQHRCSTEAVWWARWKQTHGQIAEEEHHEHLWSDWPTPHISLSARGGNGLA